MRRIWPWIVGGVLVVLLLAFVSTFFINEPLRRAMQREANDRLVGYRISIGKLHYHPIGFWVELYDVTIVQTKNPTPPVAVIDKLTASIHWRALFHGRVVGNLTIDHPVLHATREHVASEARSKVPLAKKGWQDALLAIYPLKIDRLVVKNGDVTYIDDNRPGGQGHPLHVKDLNVWATNIRNVRSPNGVYPSILHADAIVFNTGTFRFDGRADFLAEPVAAVKGAVDIEHVPLDRFQPILRRYNVSLSKGVLDARGDLEYGPHAEVLHLADVSVDGLRADVINVAGEQSKEKREVEKTEQAAASVSNRPGLLLEIDRLHVKNGNVGYINQAVRNPYRVFLSETDVEMTNLSNQRQQGIAGATLRGKFMGSGETTAHATLRPETNGPNFDLRIAIESTDVRAMNPLFENYGKVDVAAGTFSFYTELAVANERVTGWVKPLFHDLEVAEPRPEPLRHKIREKVVSALAKIFKNRRREQVATVTTVNGPLHNPKANTWQTIGGLIRNAFFQAILPGFEREVRPA